MLVTTTIGAILVCFLLFVWFPGLLVICFHFRFFFVWPSVVASVLPLLGFASVAWLAFSMVSMMHSWVAVS